MELTVDSERMESYFDNTTGIFVRAKMSDGKWGNADIAWLTKDSLITWSKSRGGDNPYAESVVCILLGYK